MKERNTGSNAYPTMDTGRVIRAARVAKLVVLSVLAIPGGFAVGAAVASVPVELVNLLFDTSLRPLRWVQTACMAIGVVGMLGLVWLAPAIGKALRERREKFGAEPGEVLRKVADPLPWAVLLGIVTVIAAAPGSQHRIRAMNAQQARMIEVAQQKALQRRVCLDIAYVDGKSRARAIRECDPFYRDLAMLDPLL